ncbi:MAG TPA: response regulator [Candidatus Mediterraneibacter norfolkensis]|nr:response regulator [Candidatus Mediterraneibacter norfolkensis]
MKILIADDERHIRNGLGSNIDWKFLGIDTVFMAEDGVAAERICREHRPEIIISDIRMPGIDGLELAERAIEGDGARKVILLSGYSEFEYAKKAISIGVVEYLLKPVNLDKLTDLLAKSIKEIESEDRQAEIVRRQEIRKILEEGGEYSAVRALLYLKGERLPREIVLVSVEKNEIYGQRGSRAVSEEEAEERLSMQGKDRGNIRILFREEERIVFLTEVSSRSERMEYRQIIWSAMRELRSDYTAGVSSKGDISEIAGLYRQSAEALKHRLYRKDPVCIFYDELDMTQERIFPLLYFNKDEFRECIELLRVEQMEEMIHAQFCRLYEKKCTDHRVPVELCTAIKNAVFEVMQEKGVDIAGILDRNQAMFQNQLHFSGLDSYERWIQDYCSLLLQGLKDLTGKKYSSVISRAVDYIQQHYMEPITLTSTAETVNKSASYFSCIFKKEMGVNFNEYLNQIRIRKAKQLLRKPDAVVYQVSEAVGFHDYKYFTKVFKRICGCAPGEYSRGTDGKS